MTTRLCFLIASICCIVELSCTSGKKPNEIALSGDALPTKDTSSQTINPPSDPSAPVVFEELDSTHFAFNDFIRLFESPGITPVAPVYTEPGFVLNSIPDFAVRKFIGPDAPVFPGGGFFAKEMIRDDAVYLLFYVIYKPVGPGVDEINLASYDFSGNRVSHTVICEAYSGRDSDTDCHYDFDSRRKILYVDKNFSEHGYEEEEKITNTTLYFKLDDNGILHELPSRQYQQASDEQLTEEVLASYTKEELKLMRNEIYAAHGYVFKNETLKNYFEAMPWYTPLHENVDHLLTAVEKKNIALIKRMEGK